MTKRFAKLKVALCSAIFLSGCLANEAKQSSNIPVFRQRITLDFPIETINWEIFATPEYSGGVPGPTEFVTLVAEVTPIVLTSANKQQTAGTLWIAPGAARPWLSPRFRAMLTEHSNRSVALSSIPTCQVLRAKVAKSGRQVEGFVCNG